MFILERDSECEANPRQGATTLAIVHAAEILRYEVTMSNSGSGIFDRNTIWCTQDGCPSYAANPQWVLAYWVVEQGDYGFECGVPIEGTPYRVYGEW